MNIERFIIVSFVVHLLFVAALLQLRAPTYNNQKPIEITVLDQRPGQKTRQFVTDPNLQPLKKAMEELKKKADFLSRETQRVKEEMIASKTGKTQNAEKAQPQQRRFPKPNEQTDLQGNQPAFNQPRVAERVVLSDSTIAEHVPDVKQGGFTSLNTEQFMYYTFYARINEQIRNRWVNNLRAFAESAGPREINRLAGKDQVTELEIILDKNGTYKKTIVHRNSDNSQLDAAASFAIQNASPFLNPPSEIVENDGFIHLFYQFHIQWRSQYVAGQE